MKKAIIVGSTSGIGRSLASELVNNNYKVGIIGRRTKLLNEIKSENPNCYVVKNLDVTKYQDVSQQLNEVTKELGGLDLIIISAGVGDENVDLDFSIEERTIATNILGFTSTIVWSYNYFKQKNAGHIVAISSVGGLRGNGFGTSYSATKAYQINYLEGIRHNIKKLKHSITVTDVRPGFVDTAMAKGENLFWVTTKEKVAKQIFSAIQKKVKVVYISKRWELVAIVLKMLPRSLYATLT